MSAGLARDLSDIDVQRQLIAAGSLDAVAGRAVRSQLREAIDWFRRAYRFSNGVAPLTSAERSKLKEIYAQFDKVTGFKQLVTEDTVTKTKVTLRLPEALVAGGGLGAGVMREFRAGDWSFSVGPEVHFLSQETPISLFRKRIMAVPMEYKHLHLTSDEFVAQGEVSDDIGGYFSYTMVLSYGDMLKGVFMRYKKVPPQGFETPAFLVPMVETESPAADAAKPDARTAGWQLLMRGVTNLIASEFPFDNDWKRVSTASCPLAKDSDEPNIRILFATDRKPKDKAPRSGPVADPDSLFSSEASGGLHLGCAYVSTAAAKTIDWSSNSQWDKLITDYNVFYDSEKKGDVGDRLYMTNEIGGGTKGTARTGADALVFIHGYNVGFKDALATVARVAAETEYNGRVYMYTWPSAQSTLGYIQDLDNSEQAEPYFQSFMRMLMRDANINKIDILAHSMGSQTLLRAVSALRPIFETQRGEGKRARPIRIGQMIFAAPDVATSVFDQKIHRIAPYADRVTVYVSSTDAALLASRLLRGGAARVGDPGDEPILIDIDKVHIVDATAKERWYRLDRILFGQYGHDYFLQAPSVLADIQDILKAKRSEERETPDERAPDRFEKVFYKNGDLKNWPYWKLKDK